MRSKDIEINKIYKLKNTSVGYIKPLKILKPNEAENTRTYIVVKCEHLPDKNSSVHFIRYFKPADIVNI